MEIDIREYTKRIGNTVVLDTVSLSLVSGRIYGLRGANGSGKTMLMRAISGLIHPDGGFVSIDGKVVGKDIAFPQSLGLLLETPSFLDPYSGIENLRLLARIKGVRDERSVRSVMERVGLDPNDKRPFRKYSLGMRQRLGVACAFMEDPRVVLLDEPFNGLDPDGVNLVGSAILEYRRSDRVMVIACHDASELNSIADEIIVMEKGRAYVRQ
ncbi:ATP-binding cassette domain-containing protein [Adlercreutzia sp. R25]|uniref:ATP-binding cassette domain-containing protein n=1 Tax=Adlercreutzia shanghongiae TaxID=3111773 RepID=A0ABU6IWS6_9ACTN|nr:MULTISPECIES: ATP-binding cassette domain-containing protein [unclassified Adlercreutzia]MEC4273569.1 ATP-binding cassette domain-containing protein [Adlercreutzia sp. R25]MEC4294163.1 ATP-binding cassette domain-containing protein [Adlercreutzia sp. R22]